jgi:DNA-binding NtrC family response regulator
MMKNNLSILIVDDELSVRDSLSNWFIEDGYTVDTAEDAKEALKKIEAYNFHIILIDIKLPGMDGLELNRRIKSISDETIVIIMTAFASVDSAVQALKDVDYDYVCKPFDPDSFN